MGIRAAQTSEVDTIWDIDNDAVLETTATFDRRHDVCIFCLRDRS